MQIISGRIQKPFNVIVYGEPGVGKSTFAALSPSPLFIGAEENDELNVDRAPACSSFEDFEKQLEWVLKNNPKNETIVIDTIDSIDKFLTRHILDTSKNKTRAMGQAHGGYGAGNDIAASEWARLRDTYLKPIRDVQKKNIIILAHSQKKNVTDTVLGLNHDTYELTLHHKVQNIFVDWVSAVMFATEISYFKEDPNTDKMFAIGNGERVLLTSGRPGHLGKNRFNLPYQIPLDFQAFYKGFQDFYAGKELPTDEIKQLIMNRVEFIPTTDADTISAIIKKTGDAGDDVPKLKSILARVEEITKGRSK